MYVALLDASKAFDRVEYVKLFNLLLSKGICPIVSRFLLVLYTHQSFRVNWNSHITNVCQISNGVRQGAVLSPILFIMYFDELLLRLKAKSVGCNIGGTFCGAFGYADDITLLAPTITGLKVMFGVCQEYASEYNVIFKPNKTKLVRFNSCNIVDSPPVISFMNHPIDVVTFDKHLGYTIGMNVNENNISSVINDFLTKVNMVYFHFKHTPPNVIYNLFKTYCMPLYGCPLWDFSSKYFDRFCVTWRKAVRYLLQLPNTTHCNLLHHICDDNPVHYQLYTRFIQFLCNLINSPNSMTKLCATLALNGSGSAVSKNISLICNYFSIDRYAICSQKSRLCPKYIDEQETIAISNVIRELLYIRFLYFVRTPCNFVLSVSECKDMIVSLCTLLVY